MEGNYVSQNLAVEYLTDSSEIILLRKELMGDICTILGISDLESDSYNFHLLFESEFDIDESTALMKATRVSNIVHLHLTESPLKENDKISYHYFKLVDNNLQSSFISELLSFDFSKVLAMNTLTGTD